MQQQLLFSMRINMMAAWAQGWEAAGPGLSCPQHDVTCAILSEQVSQSLVQHHNTHAPYAGHAKHSTCHAVQPRAHACVMPMHLLHRLQV